MLSPDLRSALFALYRCTPARLLVLDGSDRVAEASDAVLESFAWTRADLLGLPVSTILVDFPLPFESGSCLCNVRLRNGRSSPYQVTVQVLPHDLGRVLVMELPAGSGEVSSALPNRARAGYGPMIGRSPRMQEVYGLVEVLAAVDSTVLITGESGTGKELVAEALHRGGARRERPLVRVNCAALAKNLLESELFGHVRGAFTGATSDVVGRFQKAHGGTIFLDEIGDIPEALQVRLLRVLQEKEIERVGDATPIPVDVRILAATHQDLLKKVRRGEFREDLYYRLKVVNVDLPPLRSRKEDLPLLLEHFRLQFNQRFSRNVRGFADAVYYTLVRHDWPGNVRELEHAVEHAFVLCRGNLIDLEHLPPELRQSAPVPRQVDRDTAAQAENLRGALARAGGNKAKAARLLGMSRQTLYRKLSELGLEEAFEESR